MGLTNGSTHVIIDLSKGKENDEMSKCEKCAELKDCARAEKEEVRSCRCFSPKADEAIKEKLDELYSEKRKLEKRCLELAEEIYDLECELIELIKD
jgi:hypothetical protein